MQKTNFSGKVQELVDRANSGNIEDVDYILNHLTPDVTLSVTKFVDYALSLVVSTTTVLYTVSLSVDNGGNTKPLEGR
jgi:ABC-type microcin C transport system permease subunit YejE